MTGACRRLGWLLGGLVWIAQAHALVEIGTVGPTVPAAPYLQDMEAETDQALPRVEPTVPTPVAAVDVSAWLPVTTPELTPGPLEQPALSAEAQQAAPSMAVPLFVVGGDELSLRWLATMAPELKRLGAAGLAVEVRDRLAWERLHQAADGLDLVPVSGTSLAHELGLKHYPVLISHDGARQ